MPVRINLLSEVIAAEEERRNDPVKRAMWLGSFFVFLILLWYSTLLFEQMVISSHLEEKKTEWSRLEPANKELRVASNSIRDAMDRISALDRLATNRFLWAPVLNALQYTTVDEHVQIVRLSGTHTYKVVSPPTEEENNTGAKATSTSKNQKPPSSTESITLTLDARDYGTQTEQNFNEFIDSISGSDYFKGSLGNDGVKLAKLLPPSSTSAGGGEDRTFILFTVECRFPEKERK